MNSGQKGKPGLKATRVQQSANCELWQPLTCQLHSFTNNLMLQVSIG